MTNFEFIKTLNKEQMANFMLSCEYQELVGKYVMCDEMYCCDCKENLKCFMEWLDEEYKPFLPIRTGDKND